MTGFGRAERSNSQRKITVEFRSLNSKALDVNLRIAGIYREKEAQIRTMIASRVSRGKLEANISYQNIATSAQTSINHDLFKKYFAEISGLLNETGRDQQHETNILGAVLRMPDVMASPAIELEENEFEMLFEALEEALGHFDTFRNDEGAILIADLLQRIDNIEELSLQIPQYDVQRIETVKTRILDNLSKLHEVTVDSNRFEQEMIYYLEKLDITEEKVRLKQHLQYFREAALDNEAGRKLGFITQEIGREINTTGSKANHVEIQKIVVQMKNELEKIKEQLLNIL